MPYTYWMKNQIFENISLRSNAKKKDVYRAVLGKVALVVEKQKSIDTLRRTFKNEMVECEECGIGYKTELCPLCNVELTLSMNNVDVPRKG